MDNVHCPSSAPNCEQNITITEVPDDSVILGPQSLMIPNNNVTGLTIEPSKTNLPFYAIFNNSALESNEAYRIQFELLSTDDMPFSDMYITAGTLIHFLISFSRCTLPR